MVAQQNRHGARRIADGAGEPVTLTFEGNPIPAFSGDTIAAALLAAGVRAFKITEVAGEPRGGYCFSGRCSECMVIVDGVANQRSCVTPVRDGMVVQMQRGLGAVTPEVQS